MTFVGFKVDETGQCLDFKSKEPIKGCQVPLKVCECLFTQGVNLQKEDCNKWTKYAKCICTKLLFLLAMFVAKTLDHSK